MTSIESLLSPVRAHLEEQNKMIQNLEQQLARAKSDLAAATQANKSAGPSNFSIWPDSALAASLPADDIGDLAISHAWTGFECVGGVFYNILLRRIIPNYDNIDTESRTAVKAAVFTYLSQNLEFDPKYASHLQNAWHETYIVPDHKRAAFLDWVYPELERCFPELVLPFSNDLFRDLDAPKSTISNGTLQAKPPHEKALKNMPAATFSMPEKPLASETQESLSGIDIDIELPFASPDVTIDGPVRYSCPYPNCQSKPKNESGLKTHINDNHRDLDLVLPSGFATVLVRNKDGKLNCICNKFETKSATSLKLHIISRKCFQALEDGHALQQQRTSSATSSLKRAGSEDTANQKKAPGSSAKKRK
ncbi:hypothetical protein BJ741DRAFT_715588 [Chytriomyces cf. hyalinus JEL632]|nr:hypothetical protein BJ741DRAFT_715588 [Chytriomyces cf. hyalinus JEL632]